MTRLTSATEGACDWEHHWLYNHRLVTSSGSSCGEWNGMEWRIVFAVRWAI